MGDDIRGDRGPDHGGTNAVIRSYSVWECPDSSVKGSLLCPCENET